MVLKSQDLLSDATVIRTPNQNGSCSSNGASSRPLKWKPRSVSAVRDFPRGCGSIVHPVNTETAETQVESVTHDITKSAEDGKMELIVECHKEKGDNLVMLKDEISSPVTGVIEVDDNGGSINAIKESTRKLKFPQRRVSAVREFPPYCGLNATEPTKEERIRINGKRRFGIEDKGNKRNERLTDSVVVGGENSNGNVKDDSLHKTQSKESNESLMENQDPKGDKSDKASMEKMIVVDEESNINVQKGKAPKLKDDLDNKSQIASQIIKKVCQDLVVYTCDNNLNKRSVIDVSDEDSEENLGDEGFRNSEPQVVMPIRSLAPIQENVKKVKGESKRVSRKKHLKDDTNTPVFIRGDRRVVIGLMAPSVVPFITPKKSKSEKVKVVEESSAFTTSITPIKSESEKVEVVEEASTHTTSITPNKSKSEKVKVVEESSAHTTSIKPKKSKLEKVKVVEESSTFTTSITPKKLELEKVKVVEESSAHTTSITPKKSKSEKVKVVEESSTDTMKSESEKVKVVEESSAHTTSVTPKKSKSKKVKVVEESSAHTTSTSPKKSKSKKVKVSKESTTYTGTLDIVVRTEEPIAQETEEQGDEFPNSHEVEVAVPPFGPRSSNSARNRIRETLRRFQVLCRKLLQGEEAKISEDDESKHVLTGKRVDLTAKSILEKQGKIPDRGKKTYGSIPGIEVGDEFQYRVELALVGLHWLLQGGIDYIRHGNTKTPVAVSVVASGGYDNELNKPECLIYSGSGGIGKDKQILDQKLERGNIALKNNINLKIPVRVIRGYKGKSTEPSSKSLTTTYIYDGLYTVEKYWQEKGPHGNLVFKFELKRIPGQPELAIREVKSKKFKTREGLCVDDITNGKEKIRIAAVNTINDEKPPSFNYIMKIMYPDWYRDRRPVPPTGCDCVGRCSDKRCKCATKNGGEIPYNHNGAIVEAKPLVYECGPACKCPPSCYNRVTQHGMKIQLEIFKTETRGWGVRSLNSISSGSFICEYVGELLEDTEAEKRTGNDEYLFDIGQNYSDMGTGVSMGMGVDTGTDGFTIDAANYGNVGRFINHSCSPNLYAQNVLYDQEDKRMPHIMLFAAENIPPLQELTYHYNYAVDTVHDSDGNIKVKKCFCGSSECTGRLY
ncbi:hypothetical protein Lser_V15G30647 [Lactuca serriola]